MYSYRIYIFLFILTNFLSIYLMCHLNLIKSGLSSIFILKTDPKSEQETTIIIFFFSINFWIFNFYCLVVDGIKRNYSVAYT